MTVLVNINVTIPDTTRLDADAQAKVAYATELFATGLHRFLADHVPDVDFRTEHDPK